MSLEEKIKSYIRDIPDFPQKGIIFRDITPLLKQPAIVKEIIDRFEEFAKEKGVDVVAAIESRGFIFAMPLCLRLEVPFVPIRKEGKLPWETVKETYELEYGTATIEMHKDAIVSGQRVLLIDDLLATGGTSFASAKLVEKLGGKVVGIAFVIELTYLNGREKLKDYDVLTLVKY
ncbi:adenine phosphoribosyltransferase [bacterium]|nr:adenine phosphoribosyltransferase [bacterium]